MLRASPRLLLTVTLTAALLVGGPATHAAVPETVLRSSPIAAGALLPKVAGPALALTPGGALRAVTDTRTRAARACSPIWFTAVALTWDQPRGGVVSARVRVSRDGRTFGPSTELDAEGGPDPGTPEYRDDRRSSTVLWTGGGRCSRIALDLPAGAVVSDVRAFFINSSGTADGPGTGPANRGPVATAPPSGAFSPMPAEAMTAEPAFITRQEWGADPSLMNCKPDVAPAVKMAFVHHTAGSNSYTRAQADDVVRSIYAFHTNGRGWCDIAYNFLVDRFGDVFEGRSGGMTVPVVGAATQGFNTGSFSVSMMGNFDTHAPPKAAMRSLRRVLSWRLDVAHVPPKSRALMTSAGGDNTRYEKGTRVLLRAISGHRDTGYTDCPGTVLYRRLGNVRDAVNEMGLPRIYRPALSSPVIAPGVDPLTITAKGTEPLTWSIEVVDGNGDIIGVLPGQVGQTLNVTWLPSDAAPYPREAGTYAVVVRGRAEGGKLAREALLPFEAKVVTSPSPPP